MTSMEKEQMTALKNNPWQARRSAEATGKRAKTDAVDAHAGPLQRHAATRHPPAQDPAIDSLAELLAAPSPGQDSPRSA